MMLLLLLLLALSPSSKAIAGAIPAAQLRPYPPIPAAQLLPYPPMHWHSWNQFSGEATVTDANMREIADALVETGMASAGYDTVNVVCNGWGARDPTTHRLTENKEKWPTGMVSALCLDRKPGNPFLPAPRICCLRTQTRDEATHQRTRDAVACCSRFLLTCPRIR